MECRIQLSHKQGLPDRFDLCHLYDVADYMLQYGTRWIYTVGCQIITTMLKPTLECFGVIVLESLKVSSPLKITWGRSGPTWFPSLDLTHFYLYSRVWESRCYFHLDTWIVQSSPALFLLVTVGYFLVQTWHNGEESQNRSSSFCELLPCRHILNFPYDWNSSTDLELYLVYSTLAPELRLCILVEVHGVCYSIKWIDHVMIKMDRPICTLSRHWPWHILVSI